MENGIKQLIASTVKDIVQHKKEQNIVPNHATILEIKQKIWWDIDPALDAMKNEGVVITGDTINNTWVKIKEEQQ
ncbi:MAG: hypothetical protein LBV72_10180 [Tannerella sp.]|jgi:hypothetical protein|nr:hypothetical protein [Tannerella sp.]